VLADPTQIKQVMINLGNNAGHAMREQGGELYIELTREILGAKTASEISPDLSPGHYVRIVVRDTGEGMDEKTMQRIFDPFFTTKAKSEGTGMGLSVVHGIVRDHRGAITVRSTPGKGSSFTVFLPRLKSPGGRRRLTSDSPRRG
jgi:signal transduction histidine kinase